MNPAQSLLEELHAELGAAEAPWCGRRGNRGRGG
jgi:hypothetical protein